MFRMCTFFMAILLLPPALACSDGESGQVEHQVEAEAKEAAGSAVVIPFLEGTMMYNGTLPCADCEGIRYDLKLYRDHVFYLGRTYLGEGAGSGAEGVFYDMGQWTFSAEDSMLVLHGYEEDPERFYAGAGSTLAKLDREGKHIESDLNYDLVQAASLYSIEPRREMRGMYGYRADAGLFQECATGRKYPVLPEGDNPALEKAYLQHRVEPGRPLLATLKGAIVLRPSEEDDGMEEMLLVEEFLGVWPGETCGPRFSTASLENTYWALVRLGDSPVKITEESREPHFRLRAEDHRMAGHGGCNRLLGGYELGDGTISFSQVASTMMACPDGMEQEQAFIKTLEAATNYHLDGEHLELLDEEGRVLARFESRYMQ